MSYTIKITRNDNDRRLDRFLRSTFKSVSLSEIMSSIRLGKIILNNAKIKKNNIHVFTDDVLEVPWINKEYTEKINKNKNLGSIQKIYENNEILILNKPAGLVVQPETKFSDSLITRVKNLYENAELVHRLDRNTSGIIIIALHGDTLRFLEEAFKLRTIKKYYLAIVSGNFPEELTINAPLKKYPDENLVRVSEKDGLKAISKCKKLTGNSKFTLIEIELVTGRTHQARVHTSFAGFPILGDRKYGIYKDNRFKRPLLHAYKIQFPEISNDNKDLSQLSEKSFTAALPDDFKKFISEQNWKFEL